ncbi:NB-ARC domain-containing protein [Sphaerisporangium sp. B11E5]|uniref:NB-ARC domain-containing protein n=1 Tax=Sphaerisporangium sp. B11E5 TaxID=3153563 RepID=UPI00325D4411
MGRQQDGGRSAIDAALLVIGVGLVLAGVLGPEVTIADTRIESLSWWVRGPVIAVGAVLTGWAVWSARGPTADLRGDHGVWGAAPRVPSRLVARPDLAERIVRAVRPGGRPVALAGMGGVGKSTLAAGIWRMRWRTPGEARRVWRHALGEAWRVWRLRRRFRHGMTWLDATPGQDPVELLAQVGRRLGVGEAASFTTVRTGRDVLAAALRRRRMLIVVDNVWEPAPVQALLELGPRCGLLFTTRDKDVATTVHAIPVAVDALTGEQALELLGRWTGRRAPELPSAARRVCARVGNLALGVAMAGAMVAKGRSFDDVLALIEQGLDRVGADLDPRYQYGTLPAAIEASLSGLAADSDRYEQLAVFAGRGPFSRTAAEKLWGPRTSPAEAGDLLAELVGRSLLTEAGPGWYVAHDLQYEVMVSRLGGDALTAAHQHLVERYRQEYPGGWVRSATDPFLGPRLVGHLREAGRGDEVRGVLADVRWMQARLAHGGPAGLLADYGHVDDVLSRQIARALRLSVDVVAADPSLLPGQMAGRLRGHPDEQVAAWARALDRSGRGLWPVGAAAALTPTTEPLLQTLTGHTGYVEALAITPDGATMAGADYGAVRVWDLAGRSAPRILLEGTGIQREVAISADGGTVVARGDDGVVRVWDLGGGGSPRVLSRRAGGVCSVAISADGGTVVGGGDDGVVRVWDLHGDAGPRTLPAQTGPVGAVAVTADGTTIVSGGGGDDGVVRVWDLARGTGHRVLPGRTGMVVSMAMTADGATVVTGGCYGLIQVWDLAGDAGPRVLSTSARFVHSVAVSADGGTVVSHDGDSVVVWDLPGGASPRVLSGHTGAVHAVAVTADGRTVVSGGGDDAVRVWDVTGGIRPGALSARTGVTTSVAISADGGTAVSGGHDVVRVWDPIGGAASRVLALHVGLVLSVAVSADGATVVGGGDDGAVRVWDLAGGSRPRVLPGRAGPVRAVAVSADGGTAVTGGGRVMRVWDLAAGDGPRVLSRRAGMVRAVAISADGATVVSGGDDGVVRVWDLAAGDGPRVLSRRVGLVRSVAISADGTTVAAGGDGLVRVWDLAGGAAPRTLSGHTGRVNALAIAADGATVVSGDAGGHVRVWALDTAQVRVVASWAGEDPIVHCNVVPGQPLRIGVGRRNGPPYLLELRE